MQQPHGTQLDWRVLLIGGNTDAGITLVAQTLASHLNRSLLLVEDFRMAIQQMTTPAGQPGIHYFLAHPTIWQKPPETLCDGLITVGNALVYPLSTVIAHHVYTESAGPAILAGDGILPALAARRNFANTQHTPRSSTTDNVYSIFLIESDEETILRNLRRHEHDFETFSPKTQETLARAHWLYGRWLQRQAAQYRLPVVSSHPTATLVERVLHTLENFFSDVQSHPVPAPARMYFETDNLRE